MLLNKYQENNKLEQLKKEKEEKKLKKYVQ